ncbi:ROK family protein [Burkholderia sp. Ax-1719]|uniref:ROK family protein n=1 Tax=Burkholderia sp. Ax-1719 TaxID=2608334 RepID=UPI00141E3808|nr:ROK family protein [Burkholderia sp. Ax-1719]NIE62417.1 ROK family protein [Burkholderia sp. Ax-1719]
MPDPVTSSSKATHQTAIYTADIGGSFMRLAACAPDGSLTLLAKQPTPAHDWTQFADALASMLAAHAHLDTAQHRAPLALSIAGLVDPLDGVAFSANLPCITGRPLANALSMRLNRAVYAANDADCLALAEAVSGAGAGHRVVFTAVLGTGVGGGLVADGRLIRGAGGVTGEWGHGPIVNTQCVIDGETLHVPRFACGCGQSGCVDTIGGARGIERLHAHLHGHLRGLSHDSHAIITAWQQGDAAATRTLAVWRELVADPLAAVVNVTGASVVTVGGGLASAGALVAWLDLAVRARVLHRREQALVVPGRYRDEGGLIGAAWLARQA